MNKKYCIDKEKTIWRLVGEEAVILNLENGFYYSLNETGTIVWQALAEGKDLGHANEAIYRGWKNSKKRIEEDTNLLVDNLKKEKLIAARE